MILRSYAKLNLYLEVLNKRRDNYHNLKTIFERIDLSDKIILTPRSDNQIKIICRHPQVPTDNTNLCYCSAKLLQEAFNKEYGVDIEIIKRIPVGGGLGGGSSNAATVLLGLNKLWRLNLSKKRLAKFASKIGSDVPFFIYNTSLALGLSRGDKIKPLKMLKQRRLWHILVVPKINVPTALIYKRWDSLRPRLTKPGVNVKILNLDLRKKRFSLRDNCLFNSLEEVTAKFYPQIRRIKERLKNLGVKSILMSGSGPAVFGIVSSRKEAISLAKQLKGQNRSWQISVVRTV